MLDSDKVTIKIPRALYNNLKEIIENTGFSSVNEFIVYCMRNIAGSGKFIETDKLTNKEIDSIKERLRSLGYLE